MKNNRLLLNTLLTFVLIASAFLVSAPLGHAQGDLDWSDPVNLSLSGSATNPVMVIDSSGTIHVIWLDEVDEGYKYSQSPDGLTWSQAQSVKFPFGLKDPSPVLFAGPNRSIHIFWLASDKRLFYGQATPGDFPYPKNWILVSRLANSVESFNVVVDAKGVLHVAYIQSKLIDDNPAGVYYTQSPSGGGFWIESRLLYKSEYFRSAIQSDFYIRVSTSNTPENQQVYVTWDIRAQKRIFMAMSKDSGLVWGDAQQIKDPDDFGGIDTPFNLTVSAYGQNVLLIWQVGEPGSSLCTVYSQSSNDGGVNWGDSMTVFGGRSECPLGTMIIGDNGKYVQVLFARQVSPTMIAWNGAQWSSIQSQTQLPSLVNSLTYDAILLGCRFNLIHKERLYVVGCDQGRGRDVWFLSRALEPVENWFAPSVIWVEPDVLSPRSEEPERISNFQTAADRVGNINAIWVQSPIGLGKETNMTIEYARWDGQTWTTPETIGSPGNGVPLQLLVTADSLSRLLLSWIDGYNGDLVFSWANLERANLASEWTDVTGLPVPSRLVNASDVVVDGSGRIFNVFVIPINEERGVYMAQSNDVGQNWSPPVRIFDAVTEGWERIEQPRVALGTGGVLHLIFIRNTVRVGKSVGLYYTRSVDGGATWSDVQILSEGQIQWADIVSHDETVHVAWQEYDGLVFANVSQESKDGGLTWRKQNSITGVNESPTYVSMASNGHDVLHFIQLIDQDNADAYNQKGLVLQDWKWDGVNWSVDLTKDILIKGEDISYSLSANITSAGYLGVFIPVEYTTPAGETISEILTYSHFLEGAAEGRALEIPVVPVLGAGSGGEEEVPIMLPTPTPDYSILNDDNLSASPLQKNIAGLVLIGVGVIATLVLVLWRRKPAKNE